MQATIPVVEPHSVFAPVLAAGDQFEFLLKQRMVRVNYSERSLLNVAMRRTCRLMQTLSPSAGCARSGENAYPNSFCLEKLRYAGLCVVNTCSINKINNF